MRGAGQARSACRGFGSRLGAGPWSRASADALPVVSVEHDGRRTCSGGAENARTHRAKRYTSLDVSETPGTITTSAYIGDCESSFLYGALERFDPYKTCGEGMANAGVIQ